MKEKGILINLTNILNILKKITNIDAYGANTNNYYLTGFFKSSKIIDNIPLLTFTSLNDYVLLEIEIPDDRFIENVNLFNITPYFFTYKDVRVFASVDITTEFFKPKLKKNDIIKVVFTSSKIVADYFSEKGFIISKLPSEYLLESTFNFLIRVGIPTYKKYNPQNLNNKCKLFFSNFSTDILSTYTSKEIISKFPISLDSKYSYSDKIYLDSLLDLYKNKKNYYLNLGYDQFPTYLYQQNVPEPPVNYAFQSFYDCITVDPYIQLQANNTGECYINSALINLNNFKNLKIIVLAVNHYLYGYGIYSDIQIYDADKGLTLIQNGSYFTSPEIPPIKDKNYPFIDIKDINTNEYPLINIKSYDVNDLLNMNIEQIYIVERIGYNPINFNHSNYNTIPKYSIFIGN